MGYVGDTQNYHWSVNYCRVRNCYLEVLDFELLFVQFLLSKPTISRTFRDIDFVIFCDIDVWQQKKLSGSNATPGGVVLQLSRYTCVASVALCFRSVALLSRYTPERAKKRAL